MSDVKKIFQDVIVLATCLATPFSVLYYNSRYLYSQTGFADGGDMYSHIVEAMHLKELLQNGTTNFWFDKVSLGYPMFSAYQPLPCFLIALLMLVLKSLLSPLLVFRLVFLTVISLVPYAFYKSSTMFRMKPIQGVVLCLLAFSVQSWRKFGLEISAFVEYGLLTQAFGMLLIPVAVSSIYNWILISNLDRKTSMLPFLMLAVTFLSNFFFGLYACILSALMLMMKLSAIRETASIYSIFDLTYRFITLHLKWFSLISWWIMSCLIGYRYIGGLPWRGESEDGYPVSFLFNKLINGEIFDYGRSFPWLTILALLGFIISNLKIARVELPYLSYTCKDRLFGSWIVLSTVVSVMLFLGRTTFSILYDFIPFHMELETVKYLNAVHFCGILLASIALSDIISVISRLVSRVMKISTKNSIYVSTSQCLDNWCKIFGVTKRKESTRPKLTNPGICLNQSSYLDAMLQSLLVLLIAVPLWCNQFATIGSQLTITEVSSNFTQSLQNLRSNSVDGRLLGHKALGTARSWDLAWIPVLTGKPGLMTYSRGYHDSLSIFYLESLSFNPQKAQIFAATLRLYNVHFLVTSRVELDESFVKACQMKHLVTIEDLAFYELLSEDSDYGYFDFVRIPGRIQGDLKQMRETVLKTLDLYSINSVIKLNPSQIENSNDTVVIDVKKASLLDGWRGLAENNIQVTWMWKGKQNDSQVIIDGIIKENSWKWIYSQVIEENVDGISYQAIVHIADRNSVDYEHLLMKVTYHPFWKCFYYSVRDDFTLSNVQSPHFLDGKKYASINHVTPNLMSVSLPPGRHLVVFTYRFPGILKILAFICVFWGLMIFVRYLQEKEMKSGDFHVKHGIVDYRNRQKDLRHNENACIVSKTSNLELKKLGKIVEKDRENYRQFGRINCGIGKEQRSLQVTGIMKRFENDDESAGEDKIKSTCNVEEPLLSRSIEVDSRFQRDAMSVDANTQLLETHLIKQCDDDHEESSELDKIDGNHNSNQTDSINQKSHHDDSSDSQQSNSVIINDSLSDSNLSAGADNGVVDNHDDHNNDADDDSTYCNKNNNIDIEIASRSVPSCSADISVEPQNADNFRESFEQEITINSNNDDHDDDENISFSLRNRLEQLEQSNVDENGDTYTGMIKELRKTYVRQRRNSLALPTFKS